ncbi:MAG: outer membrane beta-barrel protein [Pseudolabrys sp.]|nr:outer membrane beta-barrel protein [Pseudolabrys sp.]
MTFTSRDSALHRRPMLAAAHGARHCTVTAAALLVVLCGQAQAADMPDETFLRGSYTTERSTGEVRWDGIMLGGHVGYSNLSTDFFDRTVEVTTNSKSYGGFIGYNIQLDELVLGFDVGYNRLSGMQTTADGLGGVLSSSLTLTDYATFRGRAGYAFGQFLPYAFLGAAVGRMNYLNVRAGTVTDSRDNAYSGGFVAGLGLDVALMPNVFLRGEWEFVAFSTVGSTRSSLNTGRVGVGLKF